MRRVMRRFRFTAVAAAVLATGLSGCRESSFSDIPYDLIGLLDQSTAHFTLRGALTQSGLTTTLRSGGPYTLIAPNDNAWAALPAAQRDAIFADPAKLRAVLRNHVIAEEVPAGLMTNGATFTSLEGHTLTVSRSSGGFSINGAGVLASDLQANNGTLYVTDKVILPPGI